MATPRKEKLGKKRVALNDTNITHKLGERNKIKK